MHYLKYLLKSVKSDSCDELHLSIEQQRVLPWIKDNGDKTHRLNYDLSDESLVIDLGGYEGQWASDIFSMYCCKVYIFELVPDYANNIKNRFAKNKHIKVYPFGLASNNITTKISVTGDSSSSYKPSGEMIDVQLMSASDFFEDNNISFVNLMKINIEGGEYDVVEHLISTNLITKIQNIQIQFHDFFPDAKDRMREIQSHLAITHKLTYQYEFVWENWVLR
jgi:FkbM family methyltransferase